MKRLESCRNVKLEEQLKPNNAGEAYDIAKCLTTTGRNSTIKSNDGRQTRKKEEVTQSRRTKARICSTMTSTLTRKYSRN